MTASGQVATTREQIVQVASDLIRTRSYLGFSFQDVADQVGIRKPSLYHHFPSKEALGIEVLRRSTLAFKEWSEAKSAALPPDQALEAYFRMYRNALRAGEAVCPAGALAPGWQAIEDDLRQAVRELRNTQVHWLTGVLEALEEGSSSRHASSAKGGSGSAAGKAAYVFAACQGGLLSARMTGGVGEFDNAVTHIRRSLLV